MSMEKWRKNIIASNGKLVEAIKKIDDSGIQLVLVANSEGYLEGILTDGDVRRAILKGKFLDIPVEEVMNRNPRTVLENASREEILAIMRRYTMHHLPMLDSSGKILKLFTLDELIGAVEIPNWVVLMAGGLGKRLRPLTDEIPKPLLSVAGKPILESILQSFSEQGFRKFFISVNYKAEMIQNHFGNGEKFGIEIAYLHEDKSLGTAGALSNLPGKPDLPLIVMNGDLLTRTNFDAILKFHTEHKSVGTMAVREYDFQVPYGVVNVEDYKIKKIEEKPIQKFFVNAGIYVLSPEVLNYIPKDTYFDMPTLFENLITSKQDISAYPLREYWLDVGRLEEFEKAQREWGNESL